eukprot:SAG11_NODE_16954_length_532_cov_43.318707_1_plen_104_part_00
MNILDLNNDIMSKVEHNIIKIMKRKEFLRKIIKHKEDNFNYEGFDWYEWEKDNDFDLIRCGGGEILYSRQHPDWPLHDIYVYDGHTDYDAPMWDGPVWHNIVF